MLSKDARQLANRFAIAATHRNAASPEIVDGYIEDVCNFGELAQVRCPERRPIPLPHPRASLGIGVEKLARWQPAPNGALTRQRVGVLQAFREPLERRSAHGRTGKTTRTNSGIKTEREPSSLFHRPRSPSAFRI